jgi:hypothetical protein
VQTRVNSQDFESLNDEKLESFKPKRFLTAKILEGHLHKSIRYALS